MAEIYKERMRGVMEKTTEILTARNLKKYYGSGESLVKAVDGISLSVQEGEYAAIVGTSGSGKSTLLHLLGGLDYADEGRSSLTAWMCLR